MNVAGAIFSVEECFEVARLRKEPIVSLRIWLLEVFDEGWQKNWEGQRIEERKLFIPFLSLLSNKGLILCRVGGMQVCL